MEAKKEKRTKISTFQKTSSKHKLIKNHLPWLKETKQVFVLSSLNREKGGSGAVSSDPANTPAATQQNPSFQLTEGTSGAESPLVPANIPAATEPQEKECQLCFWFGQEGCYKHKDLTK